jgi:hypothetical protein
MAYIGRGTESISNVEVLDNLTFDGSASYTLQKSSVNFVPSSANNLLISISGVVQQGNFSVSGSTITFDTTVSASDTCDWILHYGTGLITTVADGAITEAKLGSSAVTTAKINDSAVTYAKTDGNFGKIGQVVQGVVNTQLISTSSSFTNIGFDLNITPTSASSKILATFFNPALKTANANTRMETRLFYTVGGVESEIQSFGWSVYNEVVDDSAQTTGGCFLHSPSSTSQLTYTVKFNNVSAVGQTIVCWGNKPSSLTLMEVLA